MIFERASLKIYVNDTIADLQYLLRIVYYYYYRNYCENNTLNSQHSLHTWTFLVSRESWQPFQLRPVRVLSVE